MKIKNTMKKLIIAQSLLLALGVAGTVHAGKGPQLSVDVAAYCGNPGESLYDMDGNLIHTFSPDMNVVVFLSDESDDNGPDGASVGTLSIQCLEKTGKGKTAYSAGDYIEIDPAFGTKERSCVIHDADNATEWKATVTASGGGLHKAVSDTCEEVVLY